MKNRIFYIFFVAILSFFLISCEAEASLQAQKDGSVQITFSGACGKYFEKMIRSFFDGDANTPLFDAKELKQSFISDGFKNVEVTTPSNVSVKAKMTDTGNSFLFSSGLLTSDKNSVWITLSPKILQEFYNAADEQTKTILDLFIAPVFNDDEMSEEEYLEMIGAFYGSEATDEITECNLKLTLISVQGKKMIFNIPLLKVLTLTETNVIKMQ